MAPLDTVPEQRKEEVGTAGPGVSARMPVRSPWGGRFGYPGFVVLLTVAFVMPLTSLAIHALRTNLHSHILLIPFVTIWLLRNKRGELPPASGPAFGWAVAFAVAGLGGVLAAWLTGTEPGGLSWNDHLALYAASYVSLVVAGGFLLRGTAWMRAAAFPMFFLIFIVPLPDGVAAVAESGLMLASADASHWLFKVVGIPVFRDGQILELPGIVLEVARECSGIRSTWVLVITASLASYLFLESTWHRALLVAVVIPLGILRNGLRIVVIGWLCVRYGPHMIDSLIHREGGPVFFAITLVPFFALLWWLRRRERRKSASPGDSQEPTGPDLDVPDTSGA